MVRFCLRFHFIFLTFLYSMSGKTNDDEEAEGAGLCPVLQRQWRDAMIAKHPEVVAEHMPEALLQPLVRAGTPLPP